MSKKKPLKVIDLFAGVGGFRVGLERSNQHVNQKFFHFVWGNQWEPGVKTQYAADIYKARFNVGEDDFSNEDINKISTKNIPDHELVVAGFPCQDYSVATTKKLSAGIEGKKGVLWWQIERILREKKTKSPSYLIFENVDRLLSSPASQRGRDFAIMLASLNNLGYMVEWRVINAADYGFPQRRRRVFFVGYKKGTKQYSQFTGGKVAALDWINQKGLFAQGFPIKKVEEHDLNMVVDFGKREASLQARRDKLLEVSDNFNKSGKNIRFANAGVMKFGKVYTTKIIPISPPLEECITLGDIYIENDDDIPKEYFIPKEELSKWKDLKDAKSIERVSSTGHSYRYSEGKMAFPDSLDKPSRTIITGEGGRAPSRFKHVIVTKKGKYRRLTPVELEKLNMFDPNHTLIDGISDSKRAFLMGNALVVGVVQRIGEYLYITS